MGPGGPGGPGRPGRPSLPCRREDNGRLCRPVQAPARTALGCLPQHTPVLHGLLSLLVLPGYKEQCEANSTGRLVALTGSPGQPQTHPLSWPSCLPHTTSPAWESRNARLSRFPSKARWSRWTPLPKGQTGRPLRARVSTISLQSTFSRKTNGALWEEKGGCLYLLEHGLHKASPPSSHQPLTSLPGGPRSPGSPLGPCLRSSQVSTMSRRADT